MDKPTLELAPYEKAPKQSEYSKAFKFRTQWEGRERDFVGQVTRDELGELIFFRLADEPEKGNFVSAWTPHRRNPRLPRPLAFDPRFLSPMSDAATKLTLECANSWGRVFFLDENLQLCEPHTGKRRLFLSQDGGGEWHHRGEWRGQDFFPTTGSPFIWAPRHQARELAIRSPLELLDYFLTQICTPDTDPVLALEWDDLLRRERDLRCRPLTRGSYDEWEEILSLFAQSRTQIWRDYHPLDWLIASIPLVEHNGRSATYINGHVMEPFFFRFERFCSWLVAYFQPSLDVNYIHRCTAAQHWSQKATQVSIQVAVPTQHERLEALFQLCAWLAGKATSDEIERLLWED